MPFSPKVLSVMTSSSWLRAGKLSRPPVVPMSGSPRRFGNITLEEAR